MTRSPLFYPMHRGDTDAGGAADLQTDVMRFMAILALCLVAIFALVQSIPLIPEAPAQSTAAAAPPPLLVPEPEPEPEPDTGTGEEQSAPTRPETTAAAKPEQAVRLTRPQRSVISPSVDRTPQRAEEPTTTDVAESPITTPPPPTKPADRTKVFTLRFQSDLALMRLVAAGQVGLYAIGEGRAQRMTVSDSRISFWDASTPNAFHEMEKSTVPRPVIDALARSGVNTASINWGVTLPGKLRQRLDALMRDSPGGALVIGLDGGLELEAS